MTGLRQADHDKFNSFVFSIDDTIDKLERIGSQHELSLQLNKDSLPALEKLVSKMNESIKDDLKINEFSQFLGETFRKTVGGQWMIGDNPDSDLDYKQPVIGGFNDVGYVFNPILIMRSLVNRKQDGMLARAFNANIAPDT